jgi:hypothetical protein
MKTFPLLAIQAALLGLPVAGFADHSFEHGYVIFNNNVFGSVNAPIYGFGGLPLSGAGFTAQLFAGPVGTPESALAPIATTTFRTGSLAGYVVAPVSAVAIHDPTISPGGQATFQVRAWDNLGGSIQSWDAALASPANRGASITFVATVGGVFNPNYLTGLASFTLECPSCTAPPSNVSPAGGGNLVQGENAAFSVTAYSQTPLTYQWYFNTNLIADATNATYSLTNVQLPHAGTYSVAVSNAFGGNSCAMPLAVFPPPRLIAPFVTAETTFSLVLTGAPARLYEIQISTDLLEWQPYCTITNVTGHTPFTETDPALDPARFFRALVLP